MRFTIKMMVLLGLLALPACSPSSAAVIGGTYYAVQYDFAEFFAATDHRNFQVILVGNPFPSGFTSTYGPGGLYFNPTAFAVAAPYTFGNLGKNFMSVSLM